VNFGKPGFHQGFIFLTQVFLRVVPLNSLKDQKQLQKGLILIRNRRSRLFPMRASQQRYQQQN